MKYTKEERMEIGRRIYDGELSRYEAAEEYGINDTDWNAMVMVEKGRLYLDSRSLVWPNNSVTYRGDGTVDPNSAEYRVVRVLPSNTVQRYLLQKVVDGNENN